MITFFLKAIILFIAVLIVTPLVFLALTSTLGRFFGLTVEPDSIAQGWKTTISQRINKTLK